MTQPAQKGKQEMTDTEKLIRTILCFFLVQMAFNALCCWLILDVIQRGKP